MAIQSIPQNPYWFYINHELIVFSHSDLHELLHLPASLIRDLHFVSRAGQRSKVPLIDHLVQKLRSSKTTSSVHFITGPAGSGKSTFANQLYQTWTGSALSGMLLTLNNIDDIQKLQTLSPGSLLILDAMDEYTDDEKVVKGIVDSYGSSCNLVICCRPTVIPSEFSSYVVQLDLFNSRDIATYISTFAREFQVGSIELMASKEEIQELKNCPNLGSFVSNFISQDGDYPSLLRNPLVLALFMITFPKIFPNITSVEVISEVKCNSRVVIMENFISSWFHYYARKRPCSVDIDNVVKFMYTYCQNAAQFFMAEGKLSEHFVELGKDKESALLTSDMDPQLQKIYQSLSSTEELLQVVKSGALVHENKGHFRFFHDAILEYFFSKELYVGVLGEINERLNGIHLNKKFIKNVEILNLLADMVHLDPNFERNLWGAIDLTKNVQGLHCLASNAITVLNFAGKSLSGRDLSFVCIPQADLSESLCGNTNFSGADLRYVNFKDACLSCADFSGANLNFANFATSRTISMPGSVA